MTDFEQKKTSLLRENEANYGAESRAQYGNQAVDQTHAKIGSMSPEQFEAWKGLEQQILTELEQAVLSQAAPDGEVGIHLTQLHRQWLMYTWSSYSPTAHKGLAQMYVCDERFTAYYDGNVPGCAAFLRDAIQHHA